MRGLCGAGEERGREYGVDVCGVGSESGGHGETVQRSCSSGERWEMGRMPRSEESGAEGARRSCGVWFDLREIQKVRLPFPQHTFPVLMIHILFSRKSRTADPSHEMTRHKRLTSAEACSKLKPKKSEGKPSLRNQWRNVAMNPRDCCASRTTRDINRIVQADKPHTSPLTFHCHHTWTSITHGQASHPTSHHQPPS